MNLAAPRGFEHVEAWVFDLDNTLYPARCRLFEQIDRRIGAFIADLLGVDPAEAKRLQKQYFLQYGTTLVGLMTVHGCEPDRYLEYVHDIDHAAVLADQGLAASLARLPGRKFILTNGTAGHAEKVLARIGIAPATFADIFDITHGDYLPKPDPLAYRRFIARTAIDPGRAAMFEDIARNLLTPHALGMTTVLVHSPDNEDATLIDRRDGASPAAAHVHHVVDDLAAFLDSLARRLGPRD